MDLNLLRYVIRRFLEAIPLFFGVILVVFLLVNLAPGDPIQMLVGDFPASEAYIEQVREDFGLDKPAWQQFIAHVSNIAQGNLGYSFANRRPVADLIVERLGNTLLLTGSAMIFAIVTGVLLGVIASKWPRSPIDSLITASSLLGYSIPVFWLGQILIIVLAVRLSLFPAPGSGAVLDTEDGFALVHHIGLHLLLPALALATGSIGLNERITGASMLEEMDKDYIVAAKAKGVPQWKMVTRHR